MIPANRTSPHNFSTRATPGSPPGPTDRKIGSPASRASGIIAGRHSYGPPCPHPAPRPHKGSRAVSCAHFRRRRPSPADEVGISLISVAIPNDLSPFARAKSMKSQRRAGAKRTNRMRGALVAGGRGSGRALSVGARCRYQGRRRAGSGSCGASTRARGTRTRQRPWSSLPPGAGQVRWRRARQRA
jgi:hypothetical protein